MVSVESRESSEEEVVSVTRLESSASEPSSSLDSRLSTLDSCFLLHATRLAARGLGRTSPNPTVGCVIVKDGAIVGAARTADGGRPHAEALALAMAGEKARGATAYVTLEPCAHHGKTPPCAEALIAAGIARVVVGETDPDPRVSGKGIAMLQAAGIEVPPLTTHHSPLTALNQGFFRRVTHGLPYVSLKLATSADFFMARGDGGGQWLTGEFARQHGHLLRSQHDAMLTGIGTVLADDPLLTVRPPIAPHPNLVRVVLDRHLRLPLTAKLVRTASHSPLTVITTPQGVEQAASHASDLSERGVTLIALEELTPTTALRALASAGHTRVMVEAGPTLACAFLEDKQVDTIHHYRAPLTLGNTGAAAINTLKGTLARAAHVETRRLGEDCYERYELTSYP